MKKILTFLLFTALMISLSSCAAKVHLINDSFYGQKFYQTDYINMNFWSATVKFRFKSISGTDKIILEAQYITDESFSINPNSKIILKFEDGTYTALNYTSLFPKTETEIIYGTSIYFMDTSYVDRSYSINAENMIKDMKVLTDIRVETVEGFQNFTVKKGAAEDLLRLYNEMQTLLSEND
ncbi:hypothetical protein [Brachyspira sp.]|uniref:hypothetical protein n=1 Tax=Brachyspira sp. TaxID=1977261 RepID=UPI00260C556B|nr:hypothetical protein [Brachyspira sp.]